MTGFLHKPGGAGRGIIEFGSPVNFANLTSAAPYLWGADDYVGLATSPGFTAHRSGSIIAVTAFCDFSAVSVTGDCDALARVGNPVADSLSVREAVGGGAPDVIWTVTAPPGVWTFSAGDYIGGMFRGVGSFDGTVDLFHGVIEIEWD